MRKYKVGDRMQVKLSGGRIVEATVTAVRETTGSVRLQVSKHTRPSTQLPGNSHWVVVNHATDC